MRSASREAAPERLETVATFLAAIVPFAVYVATSAAHPYWLDSAEFTAAAIDLDIPHPPGHPLACLWGKLFTLLPLGPLPFRVAVGQAAAAALALAALERAISRTLRELGLAEPGARLALALAFPFALAASHAFWFQAVRAEVYALQAALVCFALERCTAYACARSRDLRPLYLAAFALALGLANHHLVAFLAFPAAFGLALAARRARALRGGRWLAFALACGTTTYVYLPLRAGREPAMDLGHPVTLKALFWVVSARAYAHSYGADAVQPTAERFADLLVILIDNLTLPVLLLAALGSYALLRARRYQLAYLWLSAAACNLAVRAWLGPVRANPDMLGYMMPGMAALSALGAAGLGALFARVPARPAIRGLSLVACLFGLGLSAARALSRKPASDLAAFRATDAFDAQRRRALPPRAVVFLTTPQANFVHWGSAATDGLRPDVLMVPVPFLNYGARGELLAARHPELARSIGAYLRAGRLAPESLLELARQRPVFVEADLSVTLPLFAQLAPEGLLHRVLPEPPSAPRLDAAALARVDVAARLYRELAGDLGELETRKQLLWLHYTDALQLASLGRRAAALPFVLRALALFPEERLARRLAAALRAPGDGPLDLRPYGMETPQAR